MGSANFLMQLNPDLVSSYRETERAIIQGRPLWATAGFGFSVFGGAIGCILLMLKRPLSFYLFVVSLVGTVVAVVHSLTLNLTFSVGELLGIVAMPIIISAFLVCFARFSQRKGWLSR